MMGLAEKELEEVKCLSKPKKRKILKIRGGEEEALKKKKKIKAIIVEPWKENLLDRVAVTCNQEEHHQMKKNSLELKKKNKETEDGSKHVVVKERGLLAMVAGMVMTRRVVTYHAWLLSKVITKNLLQLSREEVEMSTLWKMATDKEMYLCSTKEGLDVWGLDRLGRNYSMKFKYIHSLRLFRIMGIGWLQFLNKSGLSEGQTLHIWGFHNDKRRGEIFLAFIIHDAGEIAQEEEDEKEGEEVKEAATIKEEEIIKRKKLWSSLLTVVGSLLSPTTG